MPAVNTESKRLSVRWRHPMELDSTPPPTAPPGQAILWCKECEVTLVTGRDGQPVLKINRWAPLGRRNALVTVYLAGGPNPTNMAPHIERTA
jgi:hypothetical protein